MAWWGQNGGRDRGGGWGDTFSYQVNLSFGFLSLQGQGSHLPKLKSLVEEPPAFLVQGN